MRISPAVYVVGFSYFGTDSPKLGALTYCGVHALSVSKGKPEAVTGRPPVENRVQKWNNHTAPAGE